MEKWFLKTVEDKLNKEKNRMEEFQSIVEKYVISYRDNQAKILRRDAIRSFEEEAVEIRSEAEAYQELNRKEEKQESRIADFITKLTAYLERENENDAAAQAEISRLLEEIAHLEYEKISGEIYGIQDKIRLSTSNYQMLLMEKDDLEQTLDQITRKLQLLICAKQQAQVDETEQEYQVENQKLVLCKEKNQDLEPERNRLGGQLKAWYQSQVQDGQTQQEACERKLRELSSKMTEEEKRRADLYQAEKSLAGELGGIQSQIAAYDREEERYNLKYQTSFGRNILGVYEPGFFAVTAKQYEKTLEESERDCLNNKTEAAQKKEKQKSLSRNLQDLSDEKARAEAAQTGAREKQQEFEAELKERSTILHYFSLGEDVLFQTQEILEQAAKKIRDTELARNNLTIEEHRLQKEYKKLTQGEILELSEEFKKLLEDAGITCIYGMEWLSKNRKSMEENQKLVEKHPFLPYALIMSAQEIKRLSELTENVYTSFPVPILVRERLEAPGSGNMGTVQNFSQVSFYLWFNENLLDEEKLAVMVKEKEQEIRKLRENIERKEEEFHSYVEKQEKIRNQKVTKELYDAGAENLRKLEEKLHALDDEIATKRQEQFELEEALAKQEQWIAKLEQNIQQQKRRQEDFASLENAYESYEESRELLEKKKKEQQRLNNQQKLCEDKLDKLQTKQKEKEHEKDGVLRQLEEAQRNLMRFEQYADDDSFMESLYAEATDERDSSKADSNQKNNTGFKINLEDEDEKIQRDKKGLKEQKEQWADGESGLERKVVIQKVRDILAGIEARYTAITSEISGEQKELERRVETAAGRRKSSIDELSRLQSKYKLSDHAWKTTVYDPKEESRLEVEQEDKNFKIKRKNDQLNEEQITTAKLETEEELKRKELKKQCNTEELLPKNEIQTVDFEAKIQEFNYQKKEQQKKAEAIQKKIKGYEELLTALAEYSEFVCREEVEWDTDFAVLSPRDLTKEKGILIRDYNNLGQEITKKRGDLDRLLGRISRLEQFQDEFYQKPIDTLMNLTGQADQILRQLDTILQSFDSLMEKLMVDISFVEKEKAKVVELMEDYLKEVHMELGKIDHNSTITIREKAVKMLKIGLPDWEENENMYQLRLQDYVDDVTDKGVGVLEENRNLTEFLGTRITARELYDAVVGIGNVQLGLYKIEAQREYPITWSDVARNSGGEGFLSAFVILSSLLYYMRRDDTDIFADRNEGKVLIMDNPFAQTNASHLLKPLMDMAKKTNTQLICLTGLGGESIYNRFDNIYVLTLIAANLRNGMQYLKADHMRGSEEETMIVSQIEVMEQQELVF